jgi:lambda family phage tail tape measure protein
VAGSAATNITISADDKASDVFRNVGREADQAAARILRVGASASRAFGSAGLDLGGTELGKFATHMATLTSQFSLLRREGGGAFAELKTALQDNIALITRDTQAYIANTQAAIANKNARLAQINKSLGLKDSIINEIESDSSWKYQPEARATHNAYVVERNKLLKERQVISQGLTKAEKELALVTDKSGASLSKFSLTMNSLKNGAAGLINLLGGPLTVGITAAVVAVGYLSTTENHAEKEAKKYGTTLEDIAKRYEAIVSGADAATAATLKHSTAYQNARQQWANDLIQQIQGAQKEISKVLEDFDPVGMAHGVNVSNLAINGIYIQPLQQLNDELKNGKLTAQEAQVKFESLRREWEKTGISKDFAQVLNEIGVQLDFMARNADTAAKALNELGTVQPTIGERLKEVAGRMDDQLQTLFQTTKEGQREALLLRKSEAEGLVRLYKGTAQEPQADAVLNDINEKLNKKSGSAKSEVNKLESALAAVNDELARLTMTEQEYERLKFDQKIAEYEKLGISVDKVRQVTEAWEKAEEKRSAKKNLEVVTEFEKEYLEVVRGSEAAQKASISERAAAYLKAGSDAVRVQQWQAEMELKYSRDATAGMKRGLKEYADDATNMGKQVESAMLNTFSALEDTLVNFVRTGKLEFADFANSVIADLTRIFIRTTITGPLAEMGQSLLKGFFNMAHDGGVVGMTGMGKAYAPAAIFAGAPRYHSGGPILAPGEVPIIAQAGERVLTREESAAYTRGPGPINLTVSLKNESGQPLQAQQSQQTQWSGDMRSAVVTIVLDAVNRNYMGARDALRG